MSMSLSADLCNTHTATSRRRRCRVERTKSTAFGARCTSAGCLHCNDWRVTAGSPTLQACEQLGRIAERIFFSPLQKENNAVCGNYIQYVATLDDDSNEFARLPSGGPFMLAALALAFQKIINGQEIRVRQQARRGFGKAIMPDERIVYQFGVAQARQTQSS